MKSECRTKKLKIGGMTCISCQNKIERKLQNTAGIEHAEVSYSMGSAIVTYDMDIITWKEIAAIIERLDYEVLADKQPVPINRKAVNILVTVLVAYLLMQQLGLSNVFSIFPTAKAGMSYWMLFVIGLLTSVHCVAMCGGINLSQCIPQANTKQGDKAALYPSFLYNLGRVISYTVVGGIVGAVGSVLTLTGAFRGSIQLSAGVFMVIMGINMLGVFPWLRKFTPRVPRMFARKIDAEKSKSKSPLIVGLLNGLMPCGPLQAMQIYALSTGSAITGALSMLLFSLGTVPLMFGLGALSSILSKKFTQKMMTVGAALVLVLGLSMFGNGWSLSGFSLDVLANSGGGDRVADESESAAGMVVKDGYQIVSSTLSSGSYPAITVQAGTPVKWTIDAPQGSINGCNNRMLIKEYGVEYQLKTGENVVLFTPTNTGKFPYSCWMGMIRGSITVVEEGALPKGAATDAQGETEPESALDADVSARAEPTPANVAIPVENIAVAELGTMDEDSEEYDIQRVRIDVTDQGYSPAVIVVQEGLDVEWTMNLASTAAGNFTMLVPLYYTAIDLKEGENPLYLFPTEDFEFSNGDHSSYGYVKVVKDLDAIDIESIKAEVATYETWIYPPETFEGSEEEESCH
ncbi:sulfite exporter TauE/SafE family protein [Lachnospiraceae bacterium ZAX-1]